MLQDTKVELLPVTEYEDYLSKGGRFAQPEFQLIQESLDNGISCSECLSKSLQISAIASLCNIQITKTEITLYTILREKKEASLEEQNITDNKGKSACCMGDEELVREIFFLTDVSGEKYRAVTERFPWIFRDY
jgi:hypothetical protein